MLLNNWLTLPLPPTDNNLHTIAYRREFDPRMGYYQKKTKIRTSAYSTWLARCQRYFDVAYLKYKHVNLPSLYQASYENQIEFECIVLLANQRADFQNYLKALRDFLSGNLYNDDKWISLHICLPVLLDPLKQGRVRINLNPKVYTGHKS